MQPYPLQILLFVLGFIIFNQILKFGLRYYCIFCIPLYSMPLLQSSFGSTYLRPIHLLMLACLVWILINKKPLSKSVTIRASLMLSPFVVSLIYNYFFFTPILVWEINDRSTSTGLRTVDSLSLTNITQFIYLVFGGLSMVILASLKLDMVKLKRTLEYSMTFVSIAGIFQLIAYYLNVNWLFRIIFSALESRMADQTFLWGLKRISSTFSESSFFGQYCFYTLIFYLLCFGYKEFKRSKPVWMLTIVAMLSTSTTAYWGLFLLAIIIYLWFSDDDEKMVFYLIFLISTPIIVYLLGGYLQDYWLAKEGSSTARTIVSWDLPIEQIPESPLFGFGFGTSKPLFIYTLLPHAIGLFGTALFVFFSVSGLRKNQAAKLYLLGVLLFGIGNFELAISELWIYFGLLLNPILIKQLTAPRTNTYSGNHQRF